MPSVKNIVIVNDFGSINGGAAQVAIHTALGLARLGYRVYYFCAVPPVDRELAANSNIQVVCTQQADLLSSGSRFLAALQGLWNRKSARQFGQLLATLSPEETVIHVHGWTKALSHSILYAAQRKKFLMVLTLHDYFIACPNGGFFNYPRQQNCPLRALSVPCILTHCDSRNYAHKLWRVVRGELQKYIAKVPAGIKYYISVSHKSEDILAPYLPKNAKVFHLRSPVSITKDSRIMAEENRFLLGIGRLSPEKGFSLLAQSAAELEKEVVFIGEGEKKEELQKINPKATFTGWLSPEEIREKMKEARVLVFPSLWHETQGLVVQEAAANGIPALVSDSSAASELIENNVTGVLFRSNDLEDLKEKLHLFDDDVFVQRLSQNAYEKFWANNPSESDYFGSLVSTYDRALAEKKEKLKK
jgi:glycosyltransferase involved in cell wall biosynthesis